MLKPATWDKPKVCAICEKPFLAARKNARFCGHNCRCRWQARKNYKHPKVCEWCGKEYIACGRQRYCGINCRNQYIASKNKIKQRECLACKRMFEPPGAHVKLCSPECRVARFQERSYEKTLRKKYQMTPEDYEVMVREQNGLCAICGGQPDAHYGKLVVDHCHQTGRVRALLCNFCNTTIGTAREDPRILRAAADYVERHQNGDCTRGPIPAQPEWQAVGNEGDD